MRGRKQMRQLGRPLLLCAGRVWYNRCMGTRGTIAVLAAAVLAACNDKPEPQTPQEMYARVQELLLPNVEHDASDFEQALVWLRRAAEAGLLQAQTDLGGIYLEGGKAGVKADGKQAFYWFSKAAEQGSKESLYYMGTIMYTGKNVPVDKAKALEYWQQAAEADVAEAQLRLGAELVQADAPDDVQRGVEWLTRALQAKAPGVAAQAACALGNIYAKGKPGIAVDMAEAARWYEIAANGGDSAAQLVYALLLMQGEVVAQDSARGMRYLKLSAGQDNLRAIALLINMLRNGKDAEEHEQEANAWAERLEKLQRRASGAAHN